jgi:hypothetical protein
LQQSRPRAGKLASVNAGDSAAFSIFSGVRSADWLAFARVDSAHPPGSAAGPLILGWAEYVEIPEWRISRLRAKMDTGARSSALHVENIREVGHGRVQFDVRLHRRHLDRRVTVEAPIKRRGRVRPSSGDSQIRIFVSANVRIGPLEQEIELSLVDREKMLFRMLIGRSALAHRFLVDVSKRYLLSRRKKKTKKRATMKKKSRGAGGLTA